MFDPAVKDLTVEERALLDAGTWAGKVHAADPIAAAAHLRGSISGLIHALGQIDGHDKAADFTEREASRQRVLQGYAEASAHAETVYPLDNAIETAPPVSLEWFRDAKILRLKDYR